MQRLAYASPPSWEELYGLQELRLCCCAAADDSDNFVVGLGVDCASSSQVVVQHPTDPTAPDLPPQPLLLVATSDGVLRCYTFGCMAPPSGAPACLVEPPQPLPEPPAVAAAAPLMTAAAAPAGILPVDVEVKAAATALPGDESDLEVQLGMHFLGLAVNFSYLTARRQPQSCVPCCRMMRRLARPRRRQPLQLLPLLLRRSNGSRRRSSRRQQAAWRQPPVSPWHSSPLQRALAQVARVHLVLWRRRLHQRPCQLHPRAP